MTEIPEHLLKRSRAAKGQTDGESGDAPTKAVEAATETAAPAASGPPALATAAASIGPDPEQPSPDPVPAYITAAESRKKIPLWAFLVVGALPIWAIAFAGTMQQTEVEDPLFTGAETVYTQTGGCAGCHGADGGGGSGYKLSDEEVVKTFPQPIDHMVHVARGSAAILDEAYGDPDREGGVRISGGRGSGAMPAQLNVLTLNELELVVFHERAVLGGESTDDAAYQEWMEHMREAAESGESQPLDSATLDVLLQCASPTYTPGATGQGAVDGSGANVCPGPHGEGEEASAG